MKVISFNTGRGYTVHGQRVKATQLEDGRVAFTDVDRMITAVTEFPCYLFETPIMEAYDHGLYNLAVPREALEVLKAYRI